MPRLSQTLRFLQSPSFQQAQSALIGQLTQSYIILFLQVKKPYVLFLKSCRYPVNSSFHYFIIYIYILLYVDYLYYVMLYAIQTGGF